MRALAEFGRRCVGDHLEFGDAIQRGHLTEQTLANGVVVGHAIDGGSGAAAVGGPGNRGVRSRALYSGRQREQSVDIGAAVEGHGFDLLTIHHAAD